MWAKALAAGVPDDVFWRSTPSEVVSLMRELGEIEKAREKRAVLRAGLVAAAVYNVHRKRGTRPIQPKDFLREERQVLSPEQSRRAMKAWADEINRRHEA